MRLLGLTTPVGVSIGDVEVAVARQVPGSDRVEFRPAEATAWLGRTLLWTLPDDGDWSPGIYQFRMEAGDTTTSLAVAIMTGPLR